MKWFYFSHIKKLHHVLFLIILGVIFLATSFVQAQTTCPPGQVFEPLVNSCVLLAPSNSNNPLIVCPQGYILDTQTNTCLAPTSNQNTTRPGSVSNSTVTGSTQVEKIYVSQINLTQTQDNFGDFVYNFSGDVWFETTQKPQSVELFLAKDKNDIGVNIQTVNNPSSPFSFNISFDPGLQQNLSLQSGDIPYFKILADGQLIYIHRLSAFTDPQNGYFVDWQRTSISPLPLNPPHDKASVSVWGSVRRPPVRPPLVSENLHVRFGPVGQPLVRVSDFVKQGSSIPSVLIDENDGYNDKDTGQQYSLLPDTPYFIGLYSDNDIISQIYLGSFTRTQNQAPNSNVTNSANSGRGGLQSNSVGLTNASAIPQNNTGIPAVGNATVNMLAELETETSSGGLVPNCAPDCGFNDLIQLIENILNFLFLMITPIIAVVAVYGGFLYLTGGSSPDKRKKASTLFLNIAIGLFIILTAWLVVVTILRALGVDESYSLLDL